VPAQAQTLPQPPVTLDVIVDDARSSRPLAPGDFVVTGSGAPLSVRAAHLVQPGTTGTALPAIGSNDDEQDAASRADRLVGIYIDEFHLRDDIAWATTRDAVASFLRASLGPRDLVLVVKPLDSLMSLRMSADREAAARVVETAAPRQNDYVPRTSFEREFFAGDPARLDIARNQIALSAIGALSAHLGQFPAGRKTLIVVSNGVERPVVSRRDAVVTAPDAIGRAANMAHVAIYTLRPSPAQPSTDDSARPDRSDVLARLAEQTTGLAVSGARDIPEGLQQAFRDASRYYVLDLDTPSPVGGRFQPVTVALRASAAPLRARAGFGRLIREPLIERPTPPPPGLAVPRHTSTLIRTWFGQAATDSDATRLTFVWEPAPRVPGGRGVVVAPARISMTVTLMDGTPVFEGQTGPSGRGAMLVSTARPELSFSARPGTLLVQMDVLDPAGRVLDHDVRDVTVTAFTRPIGFGSAAVFRGRSRRDVEAILNTPDTVAPVAAREFSRAEQLVVRIPLLAHGDAAAVSARLQSRFGSPVRDLPATVLGEEGQIVQVALPLASLASGAYSLVLTARNSLGSAVESVDFSVTP